MPHEITKAFSDAGFPLCKTLEQMLDDHFSHCTDRRGCGFTQSTRFLSTFINQPADFELATDLGVFANWPIHSTEKLATLAKNAGWPQGWRQLDQAPQSVVENFPASALLDRLCELFPLIQEIKSNLELPESKLFLGLFEDLLTRSGAKAPEIEGMPVKPEIGSCSQAEEFFLEIAHSRIRRGGEVNIIVADDGTPVMVEKMKLGESHSATVIAPIRIFGVWIPPGSLCALQYKDNHSPFKETPHGHLIPLSEVNEARFLRLTTLAVAPEIRQRTFAAQVEAQIRTQMLSPTTTTIEQLRTFAEQEISG